MLPCVHFIRVHANTIFNPFSQEIAGANVGATWPRKFMDRHPELKIKKTSALEECRARSLNPTVVAEFFTMLEDVIEVSIQMT